MKYTADAALVRLNAITPDEVIDRDFGPERVPLWFEYPTYTLHDGWKITAFIDCYDWDYIEEVVAPDGTVFSPPDDGCVWDDLFQWRPDPADPRWGLKSD